MDHEVEFLVIVELDALGIPDVVGYALDAADAFGVALEQVPIPIYALRSEHFSAMDALK